LKESGDVVGNCSIRVTHPHHREGELHVIVRRTDWGKGYGSEAIEALLNFGFGDLYLHRMYSVVDPEDVATARVLEKNGLKREGHFREHKWIKDDWRDSLYYAVLDYEWEKLREQKEAASGGAARSS
jgi:RimJ/RimL family protein N-acetyltransferase